MFKHYQPSRCFARCALAVGILSCLGASPVVPSKAEFVKILNAEWDRLDVNLTKLEGDYTTVFSNANSDATKLSKVRSMKNDYMMNAAVGGKRSVVTDPNIPGGTTISCNNPSNNFIAGRGNQANPLTISAFSNDTKSYGGIFGASLYSAQQIDGFPLRDFVDGPMAKFTNLSRSNYGGKEVLRFDFNRIFRDTKAPIPGFAYLDPNCHYAVVYWEQRLTWGRLVNVNTYQEQIKDFPFPQSVVYEEYRNGDTIPNTRRDYQFSVPRLCQAPPEVFTLAEFGLREPGRMSSWKGWVIGANAILLVFFVIVFLLRLWQRKPSTPQLGKPASFAS